MSSSDKASLQNLLDPEFGIPPDITFSCGEQENLGEVHAHKIVLALKSTVFKKMFYTPGEKLETNVVTNLKVFKLMINFMYEKKDTWERISLVELFQVAFLATKYNMEGLMDRVVEECRIFPSTGLEILDAASIAEEFQDLFPQAAEAVLETCTSKLQQHLTAPEHFIQFASEHSTNPARSVTAFRLLARLKTVKGRIDIPCTSVVAPTIVKDSKQMEGKKSKGINIDNPSTVKTGILCSNCQQVPCLDGHTVMDIEKVKTGCQLRTVQGAELATVVKSHPQGNNARPLKVKMGGICKIFSLQNRNGHNGFNYDCGGAKTENSPSTAQKACKPGPSSRQPPPPFSCTNCRQSPCLHNKPVLDTKKVPVGCHLLSASVGYFKDAAPMLAIVVKVDEPGYTTNPLRVEWQGGCPGSGNSYKKMQNCPIPTKAKHTPTFTYFCTGDL